MSRARDLANSADNDITGTLTVDDITLSGNITVGGTVDGRDIAADGTKLDGIETNATADQTKADIDALNINADTLDGQHGSYYTSYADTAVANLVDTAPSTLDTLNELAAALGDDPNFSTTVTNNIATKLPLAGGTMTGAITFAAGQTFDGRDVSADGSKLDGIESGATADQTASEILTAIKTVDGSGSGLDADTLDGVQLSSIARTDIHEDFQSSVSFASPNIDPDGYASASGGFGYITDGSGWSAKGLFVTGGTGRAAAMTAGSGYIYFGTQDGTNTNSMNTWLQVEQSNKVAQFTATPTVSGSTIWHSGNDGSGSGLDADLLDGQQGSYYYPASNPSGYTTFTANQSLNTTSSPTFSTVTATHYGNGSNLTGIIPKATGAGGDEIFWENGQTVTTNYTITNNKNAMSAGPITINSGVTVTVGTGETWTVV